LTRVYRVYINREGGEKKSKIVLLKTENQRQQNEMSSVNIYVCSLWRTRRRPHPVRVHAHEYDTHGERRHVPADVRRTRSVPFGRYPSVSFFAVRRTTGSSSRSFPPAWPVRLKNGAKRRVYLTASERWSDRKRRLQSDQSSRIRQGRRHPPSATHGRTKQNICYTREGPIVLWPHPRETVQKQPSEYFPRS